MQIIECYKILNVSPGDEWATIRQSYYSLAKKLHPDINPDKSNTQWGNTQLKEINQAYSKLESHYKDNILPSNSLPYPNCLIKFKNLVDNSALKAILRSSIDFLETLDDKIFQLDIQKHIKVTESVIKKGGSLNLNYGKERVKVKIPSGDWNQMSLRISGKGEHSLFSKRRGDLLIKLSAPIEKISKPKKSRFSYDMKISTDKIADRRVMTLNSSDGPIKFILPRNTLDGQSFTLRSNTSSETLHVLTIHLE